MRGLVVAAFVFLSAPEISAQSTTACQAEVMRRAGSYYACRLDETARALEADEEPAYEECSTALRYRWRRRIKPLCFVAAPVFEQLLIMEIEELEAFILENVKRERRSGDE